MRPKWALITKIGLWSWGGTALHHIGASRLGKREVDVALELLVTPHNVVFVTCAAALPMSPSLLSSMKILMSQLV